MASPWIIQWEEWMANRGVISQRRPSRPMAETTIRVYLAYIRPVMEGMGYLGPGSKALREISAREIIDFMESRWPDLGDSNPNAYNLEIAAVRKLAEFVHFEIRGRHEEVVLTKEQVDSVKNALPKAHSEPNEIELTEDFLARLQQEFFPWLKDHEPELYAISGWMFHTEMRFNEARNVHVDMDDLEKGAAMRVNSMGLYDPDGHHLKVDRKRRAGKRRIQKIAPLPGLWPLLDWWMETRKDRARDGVKTLFITRKGRPWSGNSGSLIRALRRAGARSGIFTGSCTTSGDHPTGEISLLKTHTIGRKAGITFDIHSGASDVDAMKRSGHSDPKVFHRHYPKVDSASSTRRISELHDAYWSKRNGDGSDQVVNVRDLFNKLRDLPRDEREELGLMLLRGDSV